MAEVSRRGRHAALRQLIGAERYASQAELADALAAQGIEVSQGTLSKDLAALGAIRRRSAGGTLVYAAPDQPNRSGIERLAQLSADLVQDVRTAGNQIVLKTPPGAAQYYAATVDAAGLTGVIGTIAGDDTVLVIASDAAAAEATVSRLSQMMKQG